MFTGAHILVQNAHAHGHNIRTGAYERIGGKLQGHGKEQGKHMTNSEQLKDRARILLMNFKGDRYAFGVNVIGETGKFASEFGKSALVVANSSAWLVPTLDNILDSLRLHGVKLAGNSVVQGAAPNAPREDVYRITTGILQSKPDCLVAVGGGSTIDAVKAANVLASLGKWEPEIDSYFGTGLVTEALEKHGVSLLPYDCSGDSCRLRGGSSN